MECSLIIPAYNAEKTIATCLESASNQSLSRDRYEIIVVDDGSTDDTAKIVRCYPIKFIQQQNAGPAVARNRGVSEAQGNILVFTDSDCELDFDLLKKITAPIENDPDIVGVQGRYKTKQKEFMAQFVDVEIETRYRKLAKNKYIDFIGTYAAAYKRNIFQQYGGFDTGFPLASGEDTEFSYKLYKDGQKMVFEPEAYVFHQHPSKLTHYLKTKFYRGYWRIRLYKKHPKKIFRDSYTPQSLKIQIMSVPLTILCILLSIFNLYWLIPLSFLFTLFLFYSMPFIAIFKKHQYPLWHLIPLVLLLRAIVIPLGMAFGIINEIRHKIPKRFHNLIK